MLTAAVGFTVKSGWAAAVLLTGSPSSIQVVDSRRVELSDPAIPESRQPYHDGFGTARQQGPDLSRLVRSVRRYGTGELRSLFREYRALRHPIAGVGVVVGSLIDPETIANEHIRIHAREGQLFRSVVEQGAVASGVSCTIWRERDLYEAAAELLRLREQRVREAVKALGKTVTAWRAEQKTAAVAAWLVLASTTQAAAQLANGFKQ